MNCGNLLYTTCDHKITVIFKFRELCLFDFLIFSVMLVHMSVIYVDIYQPFWIVSLFLTVTKVSRGLMYASIFYYSTKTDQKNCLKFCVKN